MKKDFFKNNKNKIIGFIVVALVLIFAFWYGGDAPGSHGWVTEDNGKAVITENNQNQEQNQEESQDKNDTDIAEEEKNNKNNEDSQNKQDKQNNQKNQDNQNSHNDSNSESQQNLHVTSDNNINENNHVVPAISSEEKEKDTEYSKNHGMEIDDTTGEDKYKTEPVPEGKPVPTEPENAVVTDKKLKCTLSIRCDTVLNNMSYLAKEKKDIIPKDGVIMSEISAEFYEGESVFNLLLRETKRNKIHMEFTNTPIYNSAYIEGIGNLYEFDCGELSGWMYCVNGWFPNYGCSRYMLKDGDKVEFLYTCDLGNDIGGGDSARNGR